MDLPSRYNREGTELASAGRLRELPEKREFPTGKQSVYLKLISECYCFLKYSAAFSGSMVEISILVPISNPAQIEVLGIMVQCQ